GQRVAGESEPGESAVGRPVVGELVVGQRVAGEAEPGESAVGQPVVGESVVAEPAIRRPTVSLRRILPSILLNAGIPLLVYTLLRSRVGSDATALAIGAVIPVAVTAIRFGWRRRLDPAGVIAGVAFGIALLVLVLSGGN